jgi:hypothetical protein
VPLYPKTVGENGLSLFITENNMFRITPKLFVFLKIKPHWHHSSVIILG